MRRCHIHLVEVRQVLGEHLHERKADRGGAGPSHPQMPVARRRLERLGLRHFVQYGFGRVSS
jgi:hypothetical protein